MADLRGGRLGITIGESQAYKGVITGALALAKADPASDPVSSFRFAMGKLGLQLESTKGPGDLLVIDHVEKPSQN